MQNVSRLKKFRPSTEKAGRTPVTQEARRMPNMKRAVKRVPRSTSPRFPLQPAPSMVVLKPETELPPTQPVAPSKPAGVSLEDKNSAATLVPAAAPRRSTRSTGTPARF